MDNELKAQLENYWNVADTETVYDESPRRCPHCNRAPVFAIHVDNDAEGYVFWECQQCKRRFLAFNLEATKELLQNSWFNLVELLQYDTHTEGLDI